ncbi:LysR family transcriptional regulator [Chromobacterium subtsugae]|uniref:LysR family transcriptional regulator n=1 Tax=Chromobacterium subtsugae TaxID=251747 RepID=A0ABS7FFH7_9NEIS|nr:MULTISPECIES: LysR family transcriptional regulator [Chromobacterium]KUM01990.1 hypothetical protein Cv017_05275 [Chromobacterium subtsugae]KZE85484.1 hypothetical protein AWB61_19775 [Chromobacterium sp. F49]MBW7567547.1 LysR family transcriptional regulator [Chromobacterium subtsugae]MBW8288825.1 LysR family transcriptional regulator [Chromobacterium subtsugae]OBU87047.1 hypothetical protein MY55_05910 [Chromobacterium subtsugae]
MDWNLVQAFLAAAEAGSLSAAADKTRQSQPTLSRQVAALEAAMGVSLFERSPRGLRLTQAGEALLAPARAMRAAAAEVATAAEQGRQLLPGTVRVAASEMTAAYLLPDMLSALRRDYPQIAIDIVVNNGLDNLLEREADIAIRHARPAQGALIARQLGELKIQAWAHDSYLARHPPLKRLQDYDWIGMDRSDFLLRRMREAGFDVDRDFFALRCDNQVVGWQLALAGAGVAFAPAATASRFPGMRPVLPELAQGMMPVWLACHRELRQNARIRCVFDHLAASWQNLLASQPPAALRH